MNKIDVTKWQTFTIEDLFDKCELKYKKEKFNKASDISTTRTEEFNLPLVNAKHFNNGIMYYGRSSDFESEAMTIDIVADGAASTGDVYAQPQETGVLYNAYLIKPKFEPTENILLYFSTIIQTSIKKKFGYQNKCTWDKVKHLEILLPVISANTPDWAYMESYMKSIMLESEKKLEKLQNVNSNNNKVESAKWKDFIFGKIFQMQKQKEISPIYAYNKNMQQEKKYPFYGQSSENNGIISYISLEDRTLLNNKENNPIIMIHSNNHLSFYVNSPFYLKDGHGATSLFTNKNLNEYNVFFIISVLNKTMADKFDYSLKATKEKLNSLKIKLPVDGEGEPDWEYMENYMKNIMQESEWNIQKLQKLDCCK